MIRLGCLALAALAALSGCAGDSTAAGRRPASVTAVSGDAQTAPAGTALALSPRIRVVGARGQALAGIAVHFRVRSGGGSLTGNDTITGPDGTAAAGTWTLGVTPGVNELEASVSGIAPAVFRATAVTGAPALLELRAPQVLQGVVGTALSAVPTALVLDAVGNPVPGAVVAFRVSDGRLGAAEARTDSAGAATPVSWMLGAHSGSQVFTASTSLPPSSDSVTSASLLVRALPGPVVALRIAAADSQTSRPGRALPQPLVVRAVDSFGNGVPGVAVSWGGSGDVVVPSAALTDSAGLSSASVALANIAGVRAVTAGAFGLEPVDFTVAGLAATSLAVGDDLACELLSDGSLYCWGDGNRFANDGNGPADCRLICASRTAANFRFAAVGTSVDGACGITTQRGDVFCWGMNYSGELGNGTDGVPTFGLTTPAPIRAAGPFASLSRQSGSNCAVLLTGTAYCWGWNGNGSLGLGFKAAPDSQPGYGVDTPMPLSLPSAIASIAVGGNSGCAVTTTHDLWCWAFPDDIYGPNSLRPSPVVPAGAYAAVSLGNSIICALTTDGRAVCRRTSGGAKAWWDWTPYYGSFDPAPGMRFRSIAVGDEHLCGVTLAGAALCWGRNEYGQLGDGTTFDHAVPEPIQVGPGVLFTAVWTTISSSCALSQSGDAYCWGYNAFGQVGDGTYANRLVPAVVR